MDLVITRIFTVVFQGSWLSFVAAANRQEGGVLQSTAASSGLIIGLSSFTGTGRLKK